MRVLSSKRDRRCGSKNDSFSPSVFLENKKLMVASDHERKDIKEF